LLAGNENVSMIALWLTQMAGKKWLGAALSATRILLHD
jgi:hypothetical protein